MSQLEDFRKHYEEAIDIAKGLFIGVKTDGYNGGGVELRDYWKYGGVRDLAYMCHTKAKRLISLSASGKRVGDCGIQDTCVDGINYFAFAFAEDKMREHELKMTYKIPLLESIAGTHPAVAKALERADHSAVVGADGSFDPDAEHLKTLAARVRELEERIRSTISPSKPIAHT